jgi:hypothetical protein
MAGDSGHARSHWVCAVIDLQIKIGLVAVVCIAALGFVSLWRSSRGIVGYEAFAKSFHSRFIEYMNSRCGDHQTYNWLITNSPRMHSEIGDCGLVSGYCEPYGQVVYPTWPIILNAIPRIRLVADRPNLVNHYASKVDDALMRHLGELSENARVCRAEMRNPFIWLREGTRTLIAIPFNLLSWFGILSSATVSGITASPAFNVVAGIIGLVSSGGTFVRMVAGLIVDVPQAWSAICSWWGL